MSDAPTPDEVEERLRAKAAEEGRGLDPIDGFLIAMSRILGVRTTDRYIGGDR